MRSDFWSLPWAAREAIQSGERAARVATTRARSVSQLQAKVEDLEKQLADANRGTVASDPTQWGDDVAEQMRAYFDAHKHDKWQRGTADNLMLGLFNIAAIAIEARKRTDRADGLDPKGESAGPQDIAQ